MSADEYRELIDEQLRDSQDQSSDTEDQASTAEDEEAQLDSAEAGEQDFYGIMNVPRTATKDEIKAAYKRLSILYHPDKLRPSSSDVDGESAQEHQQQMVEYASGKFSQISSAYQILSDDQTRKIYDELGEEGLNDMLQVSKPLKSQAEIHAEFAKYKYEAKKKDVEQLLRSSAANMEIKLDASRLFDIDEEDREDVEDQVDKGRKKRRRRKSSFEENAVEVNGLQIVQSNTIPIDAVTDIGISGVIVSRNNRGGGYILTTFHRAVGPGKAIDAELALGNNNFASLKYSFPVFSNFARATASATWEYMPWTGPPSLGLSLTRPLDAHTSGMITYNTGIFNIGKWGIADPEQPDDSIELTVERKMGSSSLRANCNLGVDGQAFNLKYKYRIDKTMFLETSAGLSTNADAMFNTSVGTSVILSPEFKYGSHLVVNSSGMLMLKMAISRFSSTLSLPIILSKDFSTVALGIGLAIPLFSGVGLRNLIRYIKISRKRLRSKQVDLEAKQNAEKDLEIMKNQFSRKVDEETRKHGLIIEKAIYGSLDNADKTVDVTIPIQVAVVDSKLVISTSPKHKILGFYDPCPGERKQLYVKYQFRDQMHETTVDDYEQLIAPMRSHQIPPE